MGHRAPYFAVINLAFLTAKNWRALRSRLCNAGIADPMRLPSMHMLLDVTEAAIVESLANSGENREDSERKVAAFFDDLYGPEPGVKVSKDGYRPPPAGFDDEDVEATFDAFISSAR